MLISTRRVSAHLYLSVKRTILALAVFLLGPGATQAQDGEDVFRGTWQSESPEEGTFILIAKRAGQASYFWSETADNTVNKGNWTPNGDDATFRWSDGSSFKLQREALGYSISALDSSGRERFVSRAQQVPQEVLGQWAKPPEEPENVTTNRDAATGFFGIWEIEREDGTEYMIIEPDRSAASTRPQVGSKNTDTRGAWAKQGSELHIAWESGQYSIVRENERGFTYKRVQAGQLIEEDETSFVPVSRTSKENLPRSWTNAYEAERDQYATAIAFPSRKAARQFYRGDWLIKIREGGFEKVSLGRFGGLSTSMDRTLSGQWLMSGQDIFMRWDDGMRKILSPIGRGFVVSEYRPGRPLDGVPSRIFAASPTDESKMLAYAQGREEVASQMASLAAAAGIDPQQSNTGWGNTFMRWAWPFAESEEDTSTSAILTEAYSEEPASEDPWWWPFWSERASDESSKVEQSVSETPEEPASEKIENKTTAQTVELAAAVTEATAEDSEPETSPAVERRPSQNSKKNGWYWPF
ncbi:MAG: hypothetical protein AAGC73_05705 [Verrucomicrobiota bacterium]